MSQAAGKVTHDVWRAQTSFGDESSSPDVKRTRDKGNTRIQYIMILVHIALMLRRVFWFSSWQIQPRMDDIFSEFCTEIEKLP